MGKGFVRKSKLVAAIVMAALTFDSMAIAPVAAAQTTPSSGGSFLYTPCAENVSQVTPLSARPLTPRKTLASPLPHRPRGHRRPVTHRRHVVRKRVIHRKTVAHRPVARKRTVAHRPRTAAARPLFRKVTYASPLCYDRAPMIAALLGEVPAPLFQPLALADSPTPVAAPVSQIVQVVPNGIVPVNDTPITPVTTPNTPIVLTPNPPTEVIPAPEPASWVLMVAGFGMTGWSLRRRRRRGTRITA